MGGLNKFEIKNKVLKENSFYFGRPAYSHHFSKINIILLLPLSCLIEEDMLLFDRRSIGGRSLAWGIQHLIMLSLSFSCEMMAAFIHKMGTVIPTSLGYCLD